MVAVRWVVSGAIALTRSALRTDLSRQAGEVSGGGTHPEEIVVQRRVRALQHHTSTSPSSVIPAASLSCSGPRIISLCAAPDGIIGKQFSFGSTAISAITAQSHRQHLPDYIIELIHRLSRSPTAWKLSASLTKSGNAAE